MAEINKKKLFALAKQASNEVIDNVLVKHNVSVRPEDWKKENAKDLSDAFLELRDVIFDSTEQPKQYMTHYVTGGGKDLRFRLIDLIGQDKGASDRIMAEVLRRVNEINTVREKKSLQNSSQMNKDAIDPIITVFQRNYSTLKWWGSLGTFNVKFDPIGSASNGQEVVVRLEGADIYRWHADRKGLSEKIHLLGLKLRDFGVAKEYQMIAEPCTVKVNSQLKTLIPFAEGLFPKQNDPDNAIHVAQDYGINVARKYPGVAAKFGWKVLTDGD